MNLCIVFIVEGGKKEPHAHRSKLLMTEKEKNKLSIE